MTPVITKPKPIKETIFEIVSHYNRQTVSLRQLRRQVENRRGKWTTEETVARLIRMLRQEGRIDYKPERKGVYYITEVMR